MSTAYTGMGLVANMALDRAIKRGRVRARDRRALMEAAQLISQPVTPSAMERAIASYEEKRLSELGDDVVCTARQICRDIKTGRIRAILPPPPPRPVTECPPTPGTGNARAFETAALKGARGEDLGVTYPRPGGGTGEFSGFYAVVPLDEVITSHNPFTFERTDEAEYPATLQERDYTRDQLEQRKVVQNSTRERFNARFVINENNTALNGPPICDPSGRALGGNGRAMMIKRALSRYPGVRAEYRALLEEKSACMGLLDYQSVLESQGLSEDARVMLVRVVEPRGVNVAQISRLLNERFTQELSPEERAPALGRLLPETVIRILSTYSSETLAQIVKREGASIVRALRGAGIITDQNEATWIKMEAGRPTTQLSLEGRNRLAEALMGVVVTDPRVIALTPSSFLAFYVRLAPFLIALERMTDETAWNWPSQEMEIVTPIVPVLAEQGSWRDIAKFLLTPQLFEPVIPEDFDLSSAQMLFWLFENVKAPARGANKLRFYNEVVARAIEPPGLFDEPKDPSQLAKEADIALDLRPIIEPPSASRQSAIAWLADAFRECAPRPALIADHIRSPIREDYNLSGVDVLLFEDECGRFGYRFEMLGESILVPDFPRIEVAIDAARAHIAHLRAQSDRVIEPSTQSPTVEQDEDVLELEMSDDVSDNFPRGEMSDMMFDNGELADVDEDEFYDDDEAEDIEDGDEFEDVGDDVDPWVHRGEEVGPGTKGGKFWATISGDPVKWRALSKREALLYLDRPPLPEPCDGCPLAVYWIPGAWRKDFTHERKSGLRSETFNPIWEWGRGSMRGGFSDAGPVTRRVTYTGAKAARGER